MNSRDALLAQSPDWSGSQRSVALAVFLVLPLSGLYASAGGLVFWLLAIAGLVLLFVKRRAVVLPPGAARWIVLAVGLPLALNLASVWVHGLAARDLSWVPLLGAALVLLAVFRSAPSIAWLVRGAALASFVLLCVTALAVFAYAHERPGLTMNALLYGKIALISMVITAWGIGQEPDRRWRMLLVLSLIAGLIALLLTGYRGGWVVLPVVVIALWCNRDRGLPPRANWRRFATAVAVLGLIAAVISSNAVLVERIHKVSNEVVLYQRGVINNSSIGSRIAMWKSAVQMYREHPLFGVGAHQFHAQLKRQQAQGDYPGDAKLYKHAHNTFLTIAAEYGTVGIVVMGLAVFALIRAIMCLSPALRLLAALMLASWLLMALSNDLFAHQNLIRVMGFTFAVCLGIGLRAPDAVPRPAGFSRSGLQ